MLSRTLKRALLDTRSQLPPAFLLPWTANLTTASTETSASSEPPPNLHTSKIQHTTKEKPVKSTRDRKPVEQKFKTPGDEHDVAKLPPLNSAPSTELSASVRELLPLLRAQTPHYIKVHIHGNPYLVTQGDTVRLPFLMHGVEPGDILRLNRAINLGSREYTLKAPAPAPKLKSATTTTTPVMDPTNGHSSSKSQVMPNGLLASSSTSLHAPHFIPNIAQGKFSYIDDRLFVCRAVVLGVESEPMRVKEKTKRRQRHIRRVKSKHRYTIVKIKELRVKSVEEVESGTD